MNKVLIISNTTDTISDNVRNFINVTVHSIVDKSDVHIFMNDSKVFDVLRDEVGVKAINCLISSADKMIYDDNVNTGEFACKEVSCLDFIDSSDKTRTINKFPVVPRDKCFDEVEYITQRFNIILKRIKFCMNTIAAKFNYIIFVESDRQSNYVNSIVPSFSDGRFIVKYNEKTNTPILYVGGSEVPFDCFYRVFTE